MVHEKIQGVLDRFADELVPSAPPERLPLLDAFRRWKGKGMDYKDIQVLFVQHHLGPFLPRIEAMIDAGLRPDDCWFVDIPYSTNERVCDEIKRIGVPPDQMAPPLLDPLAKYSEQQSERVSGLLRNMAGGNTRTRVLVVDDGAYFVRTLHRLADSEPELFEFFADRTSIVEQTTRGHRHLEERQYADVLSRLNAPTVSIARCKTKTEFEMPFIGKAVAGALVRSVDHEGRSGLGRVAILGFGPVGSATLQAFQALERDIDIDVVDPDTSKHGAIEAAAGRPSERLREHESYDVVAGCTGYGAFAWEHRRRLAPEALLVSGSSAAIEFNREAFVELAAEHPDDEIEVLDPEETRRAGIHATIRFRDGDRRFCFLNAGFPINFDGRIECLPARVIQATHVLLYAAGLQALRTERPGVARIDATEDRWTFETALDRL
jgi:hypothetical protein